MLFFNKKYIYGILQSITCEDLEIILIPFPSISPIRPSRFPHFLTSNVLLLKISSWLK